MPRGAGKRDHIPNVAHPGEEHEHAFKPHAKAAVRHRTKAPEIQIPAVILSAQIMRLEVGFQDLQPFLALATTDDFTNTGHEHIHGCDGFAIVVGPHVKGLDGLGVVVNRDRTLEVGFGQIALVFGLKVYTPLNWILKLFATLLKDLNCFSVGNALERLIGNKLKTLNEAFIDKLVENFEIPFVVA